MGLGRDAASCVEPSDCTPSLCAIKLHSSQLKHSKMHNSSEFCMGTNEYSNQVPKIQGTLPISPRQFFPYSWDICSSGSHSCSLVWPLETHANDHGTYIPIRLMAFKWWLQALCASMELVCSVHVWEGIHTPTCFSILLPAAKDLGSCAWVYEEHSCTWLSADSLFCFLGIPVSSGITGRWSSY